MEAMEAGSGGEAMGRPTQVGVGACGEMMGAGSEDGVASGLGTRVGASIAGAMETGYEGGVSDEPTPIGAGACGKRRKLGPGTGRWASSAPPGSFGCECE